MTLEKTKFPIFLPDATRAVAKNLGSIDLVKAGVRGVVVNTYHLMHTPGIKTLKKLGGVKKLMNYDGLVVSDSGGWQVFSLIHRPNKPKGKITDKGVEFTIYNKKQIFTPEMSIKTQLAIGSDIVICLDDFSPPNGSDIQIKKSVERTVKWARRSKVAFEKELSKKGFKNVESRPKLFAVIQGGLDKSLRSECAEKLFKIGFDGYGFGGYVVDEKTGELDLEISKFIVDLIPDDCYKFALGVGKPQDIVALSKMGWQIFDCTLPTRDARHERLYVFNKNPNKIDFSKVAKAKDFYDYVYMNKQKHKNDNKPVSEFCKCFTCENYSRAYLHHLFKIKDMSAFRSATIHNLRFYTRLTELLM